MKYVRAIERVLSGSRYATVAADAAGRAARRIVTPCGKILTRRVFDSSGEVPDSITPDQVMRVLVAIYETFRVC